MKLRPVNLLWLINLLASLAVPAALLVTTAFCIQLSERWCMALLIFQLTAISLLLTFTKARTSGRGWHPSR